MKKEVSVGTVDSSLSFAVYLHALADALRRAISRTDARKPAGLYRTLVETDRKDNRSQCICCPPGRRLSMYPEISTITRRLKDGRMGGGMEANQETVTFVTTGTVPERLQVTSKDFLSIKEEMSRATAVTITQRNACPAHETFVEPKISEYKCIVFLVTALHMFIMLVFVLFPPWPHRIVRKLLYRIPPRGQSYHLLYGEGKNSKVSFSAREVVDKPNVRICLPQLVTKKVDAVDVYYQLNRCHTFILNIEENIHICAVLFRCDLTHLCLAGRGRSPHLIIFCQPNSSDLGGCLLMEPNFPDIADFLCADFLFFDYPGFGVSDGQPSEYMVLKSAERVMEHARWMGYRDKEIILMGFSLGTAAAVHLASITSTVGALVLMAPFTSLLRVFLNLPRLETSWSFDSFRSIDRASAVNCPTLVCHGTKDLIVKQAHGEAMAEEIEGAEFYVLDRATHQSLLCQRVMWDRIQTFLHTKLDIIGKWRALVRSTASATAPENSESESNAK